MAESMDDILHPTSGTDPDFPDAPEEWNTDTAIGRAGEDGLELEDDHWQAVRALQHYFAKRGGSGINVRELHDALNESFHVKGGIKYLYQLFPGGPVAQGCRIAGLQPPAGSADRGFGSVQ